MLDLDRALDELTAAATRGLPVPPTEAIRQQARQVRRVRAVAGAVGAIVVIGVLATVALADLPFGKSAVTVATAPPATPNPSGNEEVTTQDSPSPSPLASGEAIPTVTSSPAPLATGEPAPTPAPTAEPSLVPPPRVSATQPAEVVFPPLSTTVTRDSRKWALFPQIWKSYDDVPADQEGIVAATLDDIEAQTGYRQDWAFGVINLDCFEGVRTYTPPGGVLPPLDRDTVYSTIYLLFDTKARAEAFKAAFSGEVGWPVPVTVRCFG